MVSIRKAKKLGIYKPKQVDKKLLEETRIQIEKTNKRLRSLQREGEYGSWASKKLFARLDKSELNALEKTRKGKIVQRVVIPKDATNTDLRAIQKATRQFLTSKTSSLKGIKSTQQQTIKAIQKTLSMEDGRKVSEEDAEFYYEMLSNKDFDWFNDKIGASTMWSLIEDAIEEEDSESDWIQRLEKYAMTMNDLDVQERALRLYDKYVVG